MDWENEVLCAVLHIGGLDVGKETDLLRLAAKRCGPLGPGEYVKWKSLCDPGCMTTDWLVYIKETDLSLRCLGIPGGDLKLISYV